MLSRDEQYWENEGWRTLCRQTINLCVDNGGPLLDAAADDRPLAEPVVNDFIERCVRQLSRRAAADPSGLWSNALSLFGDSSGLHKRLLADAALNDTGGAAAIAPEQALRQRLRDHLNDRRRDLSPNRLNVWRRLDGISRKLIELEVGAADHDRAGPHRCSAEHFVALTDHLHRHHAGDHNLPRTYATVEAYFLEFCPDCRQHTIDHDQLNADDLASLRQDTDLDLNLGLLQCLEQLQQGDAVLYDIVDAGYRLSEVAPLSKESVRHKHGLSRRDFQRQERQALAALRQCIENQLPELSE